MPNVPILDSHVHLWQPGQFPRPWLAQVPALNRVCGAATLATETQGLPLAEMIYIETGVVPEAALDEATWAVQLAQQDARFVGVVAAVVLDSPTLPNALDALHDLGPRVCGVRQTLQDDANPQRWRHPTFVQGAQSLAAYELTCDLCIRADQLPLVTNLVRSCPDVRFIVDHLGNPPIGGGRRDPWYHDLAQLADLPNIACKVSGMLTRANGRPAEAVPYIEHAFQVFGPYRVMFGSDWPVVTLAASYHQWVQTLEVITQSLPLPEQRAFWAENARHWYRLPPAQEAK